MVLSSNYLNLDLSDISVVFYKIQVLYVDAFSVCVFSILDNFTEELLALHEHQVEVMKNYYEENKEIFKLVERREALFKTMEEFEVLIIYLHVIMD